MNAWIEGPIKASGAVSPVFTSVPPNPSHYVSLTFSSFLSSSHVKRFTIPWSPLPPHPCPPIPLFLLTLSLRYIPSIHLISLYPLKDRQVDSFHLHRDFTVGNVGTRAGGMFVMLPCKKYSEICLLKSSGMCRKRCGREGRSWGG